MTGSRSLLAAVAVAAVAQLVSHITRAQQQAPGGGSAPETAKIVGIGATSCSAFLDQIHSNSAN